MTPKKRKKKLQLNVEVRRLRAQQGEQQRYQLATLHMGCICPD
jgi:hypothetical protein